MISHEPKYSPAATEGHVLVVNWSGIDDEAGNGTVKIAVISDVHGNLPALEAVLADIERWAPDEVIVNGDLVNRGPLSLPSLELLQGQLPGARYLQGNHEEFVLRCGRGEDDPDHPAFETRRFSHWTYAQLGEAVETIARWPDHLDLADPEGGSLHITHGSRLGKREGILPETGEAELREKLGDRRDLFIASHTHKPFVRRFNGTLVVNVGSVGSPFDRDPRAAYGRFTFDGRAWRAEIVRVAFDRARTERDYAESGFLEEAGPLARLMLTEFHHSRGHMGPWTRRYYDAVVRGEITVEEAVERYLAAL